MLDSALQRANMVATQLRTNDVSDARVRGAMSVVPRERFVPEAVRPLAYMERCITLKNSRVMLDARSFGKLLPLCLAIPSRGCLRLCQRFPCPDPLRRSF